MAYVKANCSYCKALQTVDDSKNTFTCENCGKILDTNDAIKTRKSYDLFERVSYLWGFLMFLFAAFFIFGIGKNVGIWEGICTAIVFIPLAILFFYVGMYLFASILYILRYKKFSIKGVREQYGFLL